MKSQYSTSNKHYLKKLNIQVKFVYSPKQSTILYSTVACVSYQWKLQWRSTTISKLSIICIKCFWKIVCLPWRYFYEIMNQPISDVKKQSRNEPALVPFTCTWWHVRDTKYMIWPLELGRIVLRVRKIILSSF